MWAKINLHLDPKAVVLATISVPEDKEQFANSTSDTIYFQSCKVNFTLMRDGTDNCASNALVTCCVKPEVNMLVLPRKPPSCVPFFPSAHDFVNWALLCGHDGELQRTGHVWSYLHTEANSAT